MKRYIIRIKRRFRWEDIITKDTLKDAFETVNFLENLDKKLRY